MLTQGENRHYDRAFINNLYRFGYQLRKKYVCYSKHKTSQGLQTRVTREDLKLENPESD